MSNVVDDTVRFEDIKLVKFLTQKKSPFLQELLDVFSEAKNILDNQIPKTFDTYTLHDISHSIRIANYIHDLIGDTLENIPELDIVILLHASFLHDIGMSVSQEDKNLILADNYKDCEYKFSAMRKYYTIDDDDFTLQEYIRKIHAYRSKIYIKKKLTDKFKIPEFPALSFIEDVADICQSHNENFDWIKKHLNSSVIKGRYNFNPQFCSCLLRLADLLDIDSRRTPPSLFREINPNGISLNEWEQHYTIFNAHKIIKDLNTSQTRLKLVGECKRPDIHRKILKYIDWIKEEVDSIKELSKEFRPCYYFNFEKDIDVDIKPIGYTFSDFKMVLDYHAVSSLLMGEKIYGNKNLGLRELIQNSIDACRIRQEMEDKEYSIEKDKYIPSIKIIFDKNTNKITLSDNGIGMSLDIIKKHFLNIGVSYYKSMDFQLRDYLYKPIGNFGIGFLSCFMLSNIVKVRTKYFNSHTLYEIELENNNEYTSITEKEDNRFCGTEIILNYLQFMGVFNNDEESVKLFIQQYFITGNIIFESIDIAANKKQDIIHLLKESTTDKNIYKINISDYLEDTEGYILIKKRYGFILDFDDLSLGDKVYFYNGTNLISDIKRLDIRDFIVLNQFKYLSIPIISEEIENDFINGMKFLNDDLDEVLEKLGDVLSYISIIIKPELIQGVRSSELHSQGEIIDGLNFDDLVGIGHSSLCSTKYTVKNINIYKGDNITSTPSNLLFEEPRTLTSFFRILDDEKSKFRVYLRNVLVKDFYFQNDYQAKAFEVVAFEINLKSREVIPDISRNNFSYDTQKTLNYMLNKIAHIGALNLLSLSDDERKTLGIFIDNYYSTPSMFEK